MADQSYSEEDLSSKVFRLGSDVGRLVAVVGRMRSGSAPRGSDASFIFTQTVASAVWQVPHNMAKYPAVTVVDSSGHEVIGDVMHNSSNDLTIEFSAPFAGNAYLN